MLKNHFAVALRSLRRHKGYAALNIAGLGVGMACSLLILLYVADERSYDRFHADAATTYRLNWDFDRNGNAGVGPGTPPPLAGHLATEIPDVTAATRLYPVAPMVVRHGETFFDERRIVAADANFFSFFSFRLIAGDPATALAAPNSVVLTESAARRYFGDAPALGQTLTIGEPRQVMGRYQYDPAFRVTGVVADVPHNSHIEFDVLTAMPSHPEVAHFNWSWVWMQVATYAKLRPGTDVAATHTKIAALVRKYGSPFERVGFSYDEIHAAGGRYDFVLQPLTDVYLGSADIGNRVGPVGDGAYVRLFSIIAVFILGIACINFMNLATARATRRAREVGVRKVLGSERKTLVAQFLVEALVFSALALPLALVLVALSLGPFNTMSGKALTFSLFGSGLLPLALVGITVLVGVVAGTYPGVYLSSFRPLEALRGAFRPGGKNRRLRHGLVVFQFALTIGLIACTLVVRQQMHFLGRADLGFRQDGVIVISNESDRLKGQAEAFKARLGRHPAVVSATLTTGVPPGTGFQDDYNAEGQGDEGMSVISYMADEDFVSTLGLKLAAGRAFSKQFSTDADGVLLNEAAVRASGWTDPIGKTLRYPGGDNRAYTVVGVVKDFNFATLRAPITPFAIFHSASGSYDIPDSYVAVRVSGTGLEESVRLLKAEWDAVAPNTPFDYSFLDERIGAQYLTEQRLGAMFVVFSALTILIACMGLLGLAAFAAEQRRKEIGVRKVLGASVPAIVSLLSRDFLGLVALGFVVGVPAAYYAMSQWLEGYTYRTDLGPWVFALAGVLALVIALVTVSTQAFRAATADPVRALRTE